MGESTQDVDGLGLDDLKALVLRLMERVAAVEAENAALRQEVRRLKGLKGPPTLRPSGMAQQAGTGQGAGGGNRRRRGPKNVKLVVDEERRLELSPPPAGSRFKGYSDVLVQDIVLRPQVIRYRRACWRTPDGKMVMAPLPAGIAGHFGPALRRLVLALCHQGQVTVGRQLALLQGIGVVISKRQLVRLLNAGQTDFLAEDKAVLHAGLASARWITVDDTGARHKAVNGFCTVIGNDDFAWFASTGSKSRQNFLRLLRAGDDDYVVNQAALACMRRAQLPAAMIALLAAHPRRRFADAAAWQAHLDALGLPCGQRRHGPQLIATDAALWGSLVDHGELADTVIVSDDAGQFNVGQHALCWVHAERLVHQLDAFTDRHRAIKQRIRNEIWQFYGALKAYRQAPTRQDRDRLARRFDRLFRSRTGFAALDRLLRRLYGNKAELLMVLKRPEIPLHTNGAENNLRCQVIRRKISGGTRSDAGRDCRDAFLGLLKTCSKLQLSFWHYLGDRLCVPDAPSIPPLPVLISQRASSA